MSNYPTLPKDQRQKVLAGVTFVFDFDGTLVPQTKFNNEVQNIVEYIGMKMAVNPNAFGVKWTIATSRPYVDGALIDEVLRKNNAHPIYPVMTQKTAIPTTGNDAEINFKLQCLEYCKKTYGGEVIYVDNNQELCDKLVEKNKDLTTISLIDFLIMMQWRLEEVQ